jgi:hypothetical protein
VSTGAVHICTAPLVLGEPLKRKLRERGLSDAEIAAIGNNPTITDYYDNEIHGYTAGMEAGNEQDSARRSE